MSVVIIGGHDRMVRQYKEICENHKYKAKVFTQMKTGLDKLIGRPDLLILFTNTVSHKMVRCALVAALYTALCLLLAPFSYGAIQVRVAEALCLLPTVHKPELPVG
mgnify:CR=1 FL=1